MGIPGCQLSPRSSSCSPGQRCLSSFPCHSILTLKLQDLYPSNMLLSYLTADPEACVYIPRVSIIDFECAVHLPGKAFDHMVSAPRIFRDRYSRPWPNVDGVPVDRDNYSPFYLDVWQVGRSFQLYKQVQCLLALLTRLDAHSLPSSNSLLWSAFSIVSPFSVRLLVRLRCRSSELSRPTPYRRNVTPSYLMPLLTVRKKKSDS